MINPRIQKAREEQIRLAALLQSGHPESEGIELAISDWFWEEMLVQRELGRRFMTPLSLGQPAGKVRRERPGLAPRRNVGQPWGRNRHSWWATVPVKKPPAFAWRQEL